ncbi:hypothetical protein [Oryzomicrobium sp.]|uniref:hypothetical protein n=1 Tax=Oryzomicrobium sp. TaxID=1911578 RepID=UPI0025F6F033|nr:hypothetical protein [Oryzomicrobium sp.]MCE1244837.1 hypothetical protein [Oryzomicrobium sp.]
MPELSAAIAADHPLADPAGLRLALTAVDSGNPFKALDALAGWLESLADSQAWRPDALFDVLCALDDAARPHLTKLAHDYLGASSLSRGEERRLALLNIDFRGLLVARYESCLLRLETGRAQPGMGALAAHLPALVVRLLKAQGAAIRWARYRYGAIGGDAWRRLGWAYGIAEREDVAMREVRLEGDGGATSPLAEYLRILILATSATDGLNPAEVDLADRLGAWFRPHFRFVRESGADSVYWVDLAQPLPPTRLAQEPAAASTLRFFSPGDALAALQSFTAQAEQGRLPPALDLGPGNGVERLLPVLRHLAMHWAPVPPLRAQQRHRVHARMAVVVGWDACSQVFSGASDEVLDRAASWVVEDISLGGCGASVSGWDDGLRAGSLVGMLPEEGGAWLLGVVRRFRRESDTVASVGVQTLSRNVKPVALRPLGGKHYGVVVPEPALWLRDGSRGNEARFVVRAGAFADGEALETVIQGARVVLEPVGRDEAGRGYAVVRYRAHRAA